MPNYIFDLDSPSYEVHDEQSDCPYLPKMESRKNLGWFSDIDAALFEAKKTYSKAKACHCAKKATSRKVSFFGLKV